MKGKYLSPKADLTFKLVFGEHKDLVMSLLNSLLPIAENAPIVSVEYEPTEMTPQHAGRKNSIVDVRCKDSLGRRFLVEMQMHWSEEFKKRVVMNASKAVIKQVGTSETFTLIQPVFSLNLLNDDKFAPYTDEFYHDYAILNVKHPERSIDYLRFVFVELPKFKPRNMKEKKMAVLWLRFLTEIGEDTDKVPDELLENEYISKALSIVEKSNMTSEQLYAYERFWDAVNVENVLASDNYNKGREKGREEGLASVARNLIAMGMPTADVVKATGLTAGEIEALRATN